MKKRNVIIFVLVLMLIDQISKFLVVNNIELFSSIDIIPNFFSLTYNQNFGAAFGILEGRRFLFIIITILVVSYLIYELRKVLDKKVMTISFLLIIGGIMGNFIDRLLFGYVRDFLDFKIFGYDYPIFNFADSFIVIGVIIFIIGEIRENYYGSKK